MRSPAPLPERASLHAASLGAARARGLQERGLASPPPRRCRIYVRVPGTPPPQEGALPHPRGPVTQHLSQPSSSGAALEPPVIPASRRCIPLSPPWQPTLHGHPCLTGSNQGLIWLNTFASASSSFGRGSGLLCYRATKVWEVPASQNKGSS